MKRYLRHPMIILGPCLIAVAMGATADSPRSSGNDDRMKSILQRFPAADANADGVLTAEEERAFRSKYEESRRQTRERRRLAEKNRPRPTRADVRYGPHERNVFDLWLPDGAAPKTPMPVFVYFHGGGFIEGDKNLFDPTGYLRLGYAVVAANYRFVNGKDILTPVPMQDCARAIQFLRYRAEDFGIDPRKIALGGGSAGAVITMWIAYKDDMADPRNNDPVCRQSTRVSCIVPTAGPTNLDPDWIRKNLGGPPEIHRSLSLFYGVPDDDYSKPEVRKLIAESSVINHVTADDPPTLLIYSGELDNLPLSREASSGLLVHHPHFGRVLKEKLDTVGVECRFRHDGERPQSNELAEFLARHLRRYP